MLVKNRRKEKQGIAEQAEGSAMEANVCEVSPGHVFQAAEGDGA